MKIDDILAAAKKAQQSQAILQESAKRHKTDLESLDKMVADRLNTLGRDRPKIRWVDKDWVVVKPLSPNIDNVQTSQRSERNNDTARVDASKQLIGKWQKTQGPAISRDASIRIYEFSEDHSGTYYSAAFRKNGEKYGEFSEQFKWSAQDGKIVFGGNADRPWQYEIDGNRLTMRFGDYSIQLDRAK